MTKRSALLLAIVFWLGATIAPTAAHHSTAMYDNRLEIVIEGTVTVFAWTNPHVFLRVAANPRNGEPAKEWVLESTSPGNLRRLGWTKDSFKPGDRVSLVVVPRRDGEPGGAILKATLTDTGKEFSVGYSREEVK